MNTGDIFIISSVSLIFIVFPLLMASIAFSHKRKDWGIGIILAILFGFGWLLSLLFLREFIKTDETIPKIRAFFRSNETIRRVSSLVAGTLILSSLAALFLSWSNIVRIAESVGKGVAVIIGGIPISGSLFLLLIIFVAFFLLIAWGFGLVFFGITGRRIR